MKVALVCVALLGAVATGAGVVAHQGQIPGAVAKPQDVTPKDNPRPNPLEELKKNPPSEIVAGMSPARVKTLLSELRPGDRMSKLVKEQYEAARDEADGCWKEFIAGKVFDGSGAVGIVNNFHAASQRLLQAELDLGRTSKDFVAALEAQVKRTHELEIVSKAKYEAGQINEPPLALSRVSRIRAEIWLERFKTTGKLPADAPALPR